MVRRRSTRHGRAAVGVLLVLAVLGLGGCKDDNTLQPGGGTADSPSVTVSPAGATPTKGATSSRHPRSTASSGQSPVDGGDNSDGGDLG